MSEYLYNAWYAAGFVEMVGRTPMGRTILGQPIVFYRTEAGALVALSDICIHRFAPLHKGVLKGDSIQCPYHGLQYGPDGACTYNPHDPSRIPDALRVRRYPVVQRDQIIWIWMGEAEPDLDAVPEFSQVQLRDDTAVVHGELRVAADYRLVADNLLDLSHAEFLHPYLAVAGSHANTTRESLMVDGKVVVRSVTAPTPNTPHFSALWDGPAPETVEIRIETVMQLPSNLRINIRVNEVGAEWGSGVTTTAAHLITPETETSSHYFWAFARSTHIHDEAVSIRTRDRVLAAFVNEDAPMIEAQQTYKAPAEAMGLKNTLLKSDAALVMVSRLLDRKMMEER